jgi:dTDP-4-amino-4,6-dideoxygalactose transaminase
LYLKGLKYFWLKTNLIQKPNFVCSSCPLKDNKFKNCNSCRHSFYRLNFFLNIKKINQIELIDKLSNANISCGVGACPEIYREKVFKKLKAYPKKRLPNAKILGETSLMFPINPYKSLTKIELEINTIKKIFNKYI